MASHDEHESEQVALLSVQAAKNIVAEIERVWTHLRTEPTCYAASEIYKITAAMHENFETNRGTLEQVQQEDARLDRILRTLVARPGWKNVEQVLEHATLLEQQLADAARDAEDEADSAEESHHAQASELKAHARALHAEHDHALRLNDEGHAWLRRLSPPPPPTATRRREIPMRMPLPLEEHARTAFVRPHPRVRRETAATPSQRAAARAGRRGTPAQSRLRHMHLAEEGEEERAGPSEERALGKGGALGTLSLRQARRYFGRAY